MPETQIESRPNSPAILVIVGITGNLSRKKLLPAIEGLNVAGALPEKFKLLGVSRRSVEPEQIIGKLPAGTDHDFIRNQLEMVQMDLDNPEDYRKLADKLATIEQSMGGQAQRLFYLSVPPDSARMIIEHLGQTGFGKMPGAKLLLEKPFGANVESANELGRYISRFFDESQVYRIDHYLAKEMAQNILTFRRENPLFHRTWNKDFIDSIDIVAAEDIGIEDRATFYEQAGALGDFVQSHLLQLAAITLMELPMTARWTDVPGLRLAALNKMKLRTADAASVRRAQYKNYPEEVKNPASKVETFVSLDIMSEDNNWQGVPISLTTGKALGRKYTEIRLRYRQEGNHEANELVLHIQPQEGVQLFVWSKHPGFDRKLERVQLGFHYTEKPNTPQPYEQVFLSAIHGDRTLFTSQEEVIASWKVLEPVQKLWAESGDDLVSYEQGVWPKFY